MTTVRMLSCAAIGIAMIVGSMRASAYTWEGSNANAGALPSLGGVVDAKVIGQHCSGTLSAPEIAELDAYLVKAGKEWPELEEELKKKLKDYRPISFEEVVQDLTDTYTRKFRDPKNCGPGATEMAQDMLQRVKKMMASGAAVLPTAHEIIAEMNRNKH